MSFWSRCFEAKLPHTFTTVAHCLRSVGDHIVMLWMYSTNEGGFDLLCPLNITFLKSAKGYFPGIHQFYLNSILFYQLDVIF